MSTVGGELILRGCLENIGCGSHISVFIDNDIDFDCFKTLSRDELGVLLGGKIGPSKKIYAEIERIRAIDTASMEPPPRKVSNPPVTPPIKAMESPPPPSYSSAVVGGGKPVFPTQAGSIRPPQPQGQARPPAPTPAEQGLLEKYGFKLPSAGAFATSIAVGTAQKYIIDEIVYNRVFPKGDGGTAPGPILGPAPGAGAPPPDGFTPLPENPATAAFDQSPYGASSRSMPAQDDFGVYDDPEYEPSAYDGGDVGFDPAESATEWNDVSEWDAGGVDTGVGGGVELDLEPGPGVDEAVTTLFEGIVNIF